MTDTATAADTFAVVAAAPPAATWAALMDADLLEVGRRRRWRER